MRQREDEQLKPIIRSIFTEHRRHYGARHISFPAIHNLASYTILIAADNTPEKSTAKCFVEVA